MPDLITTCGKCDAQYFWNSDFQEMPDCPKCGYNPNRQFQQSDISGLVRMLLKSPDRNVRNHAAVELGRHGDTAAVEPLIAALGDADDIVVLPAAIALGRIGDERAVDPLIKLLRSRKGPCALAAGVLIRIGKPRGIQAVVEDIKAVDPTTFFRDVCPAILERGPSIIQFIIPLLKKLDRNIPDDNFIRYHVVRILAQWGWKPEGAAEQIQFYLEARSVDKLAEMGAPAVIPLIAMLKEDKREIRWTATQALGKIKDIRAVEPLIEAMTDNDKDVRKEVAVALGEIGAPKAIEPLITAMSDKDKDVRAGAVAALGKIGDPMAVETLCATLNDRDPDIREAAMVALGNIKDSRAVDPLLIALADHEPRVRVAASKALASIGEQSLKGLILKLSDKNERARYAAVCAISQIGDKRTIVPLISALKDSDGGVSREAAIALDNLGWRPNGKLEEVKCFVAKTDGNGLISKGVDAVESLLVLLNDKNYRSRWWWFIYILGEIGDQRAIKPIKAMQKSSDPEIKKNAKVALCLINKKNKKKWWFF